MEEIKSSGGVVISNNTHGNKAHKGAGSPDGGQFTSADGTSAGGAAAYNQSLRRKHLTNPVYDKIVEYIKSQKGISNPNYESELTSLSNEYLKASIPMVQKETGMSSEEAKEFVDVLSSYTGFDYLDFSNGDRPEQVAILDRGIEKMAKFDGMIFRGISFDNDDREEILKFRELLSGLRVGTEIRVGAKNNSNSKSVSSWTSNDKIAIERFSQNKMSSVNSIVFVCRENKSGAGIRHISPFGAEEDEVLVPSTAQYRVVDVKMNNKKLGAGGIMVPIKTRSVLVFVEEI